MTKFDKYTDCAWCANVLFSNKSKLIYKSLLYRKLFDFEIKSVKLSKFVIVIEIQDVYSMKVKCNKLQKVEVIEIRGEK
jgi:hypothetical protein